MSVGVVLLLVVASFGAYIYLNRSTPAGASATATLTVYTGTAQVQHSGGSFVSASSGAALNGGDTVRTGATAEAGITFGDGSVTRLDSNTTLTVSSATKVGAGYHTSLAQSAGKTWSNVVRLVGGGTFTVTGPNNSTAEVRGTKFAYIIDANGQRVDDFQGSVDFSSQNQIQHLTTGLFSNIPPGGAPSPPAPISAQDLADQFTIFNVAADSNQEGTGGNVTGVSANNIISVGQTTPVQPGATADGNTDLNYTLNWEGSTFELIIVDPQGNDFESQSSASHPFTITLAKPLAGTWSYKVHDVQSDKPSEQWSVVISTTTPSKLTPQPFFTGADSTKCDHTVTAGQTDTWTVNAKSDAGTPTLTVPALPGYATITGGSGSLTLSWAPPLSLATSADLGFSVTTTQGAGVATINCTEHVRAVARASTIGGHVTSGGTGLAAVTITLTYPDATTATTTTASDGSYSFGSLAAGTYSVAVTVPSGYTAADPTSSSETVDGTDSATVNFTLDASPAYSPTPTPLPTPTPTPAPTSGSADCQTRVPSAAPMTGTPMTPGTVSPYVTAVSPSSGASCGLTPVTITGTGFTGATAVTFGMAAATQPHSGSYAAQLQWATYTRDSGGDSYLYQTV
ncbi:MAG TPA: SdrD B-like domain-containing protein, partial [Candidatus Dormibacteraeota bacterium]|nr:SdrD B-like domain-containing protein [Candidatus Dormibacteraeota bacterium]